MLGLSREEIVNRYMGQMRNVGKPVFFEFAGKEKNTEKLAEDCVVEASYPNPGIEISC